MLNLACFVVIRAGEWLKAKVVREYRKRCTLDSRDLGFQQGVQNQALFFEYRNLQSMRTRSYGRGDNLMAVFGILSEFSLLSNPLMWKGIGCLRKREWKLRKRFRSR